MAGARKKSKKNKEETTMETEVKETNDTMENDEKEQSNELKIVTELELAKLDLNKARTDMQATVLQNIEMKMEIIKRDYVANREALKVKHVDTARSLEQCKSDYNNTVKSIENRLGIDMSKCTVRDDGIVIEFDEKGNQQTFIEPGQDG